jgi:hypothetical protein
MLWARAWRFSNRMPVNSATFWNITQYERSA